MKAKELAELLLKTPDADIFIENYTIPDFGDSFYDSESVIGIKQTPSGIFLSTEPLDYYPVSPSDIPKLNHIRIFMTDGTWFKFGENSGSIDDLKYFDEYKYISNSVGWHEGTYTLYQEGSITDEYIYDKINSTGNTSYTNNEVDFVEILTEYDKDTWEVVWQKFKFDEALEFVKHIGK